MRFEEWGYPHLFDCYCEMCGCESGSCICEECPTCHETGDPKCYKEHGLSETEEQIQSRIRHDPQEPQS